MPDTKISQLPALAAANVVDTDIMPIVDLSDGLAGSKHITIAELRSLMQTGVMLVDSTSVAFGSGSPISMFSLPGSAVIDKVQVVVDTSFDGTPTINVGISGNTNKYVTSAQVNLNAAAGTVVNVYPGKPAQGSVEALEIAYSAGGATVGAARVLVYYSSPN